MLVDELIWVRGAGELGSAVAHLLHRVGFRVYLSEISPPLAIRRIVTFSDAISMGETSVEGVTARKSESLSLPPDTRWDHIPLFEDDRDNLLAFRPTVMVDGRMLKQQIEDYREWADLMIGLGPGFFPQKNCHVAIETMRGHDLGRIISSGSPLADTGIPGSLGGQTLRRLIRASTDGLVAWEVEFGELVVQGQQLGVIDNREAVIAPTDGILRGMISHETPVVAGMKIGDVDPRGNTVRYEQISEKARAIAAGVFEAIVLHKMDDPGD